MPETRTPPSGEPALHGHLREPVLVHVAEQEWQPSPSGSVWRKRFHRVGPPEAGQVTSLVRYEVDSRFPSHDHPEGEEILVLSGVFSDEHGHWPAGTYLLNPEGFRHAPFSREGCELFVKLRQYPGQRRHLALDTRALAWEPGGAPGVERKPLYAEAHAPESMQLERWAPGAEPGLRAYAGGAELFVLEGSFEDEHGACARHDWLRIPPGGQHRPRSDAGCELYVKRDGVAVLRSGD